MATFPAQINYFGTPITKAELDAFYADANSQMAKFHATILSSFFDLDIKNLSREVLDRYSELSSLDTYHPIIPHTESLISRLFGPLKSAKRCYCLGEYMAAMELSAHVAEMLALLVWEMSPVTYNGQGIEDTFERDVLGSKFERLGQERRLGVLKGLGLLTEEHFEMFSFLKNTRRKYFHLWSGDFSNLQTDARECYFKAMELIKKILQISISGKQSGAVSMNPLLLKYMQAHGETINSDDSKTS